MQFTLRMECDNDAFTDCNTEVARILRDAAKQIEAGSNLVNLRDLNGNKVGNAGLSHED